MYSQIRRSAEQYLTSGEDVTDMSEDAQFWFRRIFTNLLIGNAAGLVSLGAFLNSSDSPIEEVASLIFPAFLIFSIGLIFAGLTPFSLWARVSFQKPRERIEFKQNDQLGDASGEKLPNSLGYYHPIFWSFLHIFVRYTGFAMGVISAIAFSAGLFLIVFGIFGLRTNL